MPSNARRLGAIWFLILLTALGLFAQMPTSGDVMRDRIKKAKALVAVKNYNAAIYELEGIRKESNEPAVNSVVTVMLMNCYLEQSDYKRAQALLTDIFNAKKQNRFGGANYYAVAGQVVRGAKVQLERYKSLGLLVSDANLPADAAADVNKMRETIETVIAQSKALSQTAKETPNAMALLEEATGARGGLARDDFDAKRWKEEIADARDGLVNAKGVVDASGELASTDLIASADAKPPVSVPTQTAPAIIPIAEKTAETTPQTTKPSETPSGPSAQPETPKTETPKTQPQETAANQPKPSQRVRKVENQNAGNNATAQSLPKNDAPMSIGSLIEYAVAKVSPTYPPTAKATRQTGTVRVDLIIDEEGKPEIRETSGPGMLKQAAQDAVKRWKFKPFTRDGQPVKATGYVSFNFNL